MIEASEPSDATPSTTAGNGRPRSKEAREVVAVALATGGTVREVAAVAGVGERTIRSWLKNQLFVRRVARLRAEAVAAGVNRLADGMSRATGVLMGLLNSDNDRVRLAAAKSVIELVLKARQVLELEARIDQLEEQLLNRGFSYSSNRSGHAATTPNNNLDPDE